MKIILLSIGILLAILHPTSDSFARNNIPIHNFDLVHRDYSQGNNLYFSDSLVGIVEDDTEDSEQKNLPFTKGAYKTNSFITPDFSSNLFGSIWATSYFFELHPSLFIFLGALRL